MDNRTIKDLRDISLHLMNIRSDMRQTRTVLLEMLNSMELDREAAIAVRRVSDRLKDHLAGLSEVLR